MIYENPRVEAVIMLGGAAAAKTAMAAAVEFRQGLCHFGRTCLDFSGKKLDVSRATASARRQD
jgi:hypothetical protein